MVTSVPRSRSCDKRYFGVFEGVVQDVEDPEKKGRIKVSFPWFDEGTVFKWCRVAQGYAGNGFGHFWIPEVGTEVIVGFVHGDMRLPIVLGGLYNKKLEPPSHKDESNKDEKLFRTKHGHQLLFNDSSGKEQVEVKTEGGHVLDLNDAASKCTLTTSGGHEVELDDDAQVVNVRSSGGHLVSLDDASGTLTIETPDGQSIVMDSSSIEITANAKVTLKASSIVADSMDIKLGGAGASDYALLGTMFLTLFNTHVHTTIFPGLPTTPPVTPLTPAVLSKSTKVL